MHSFAAPRHCDAAYLMKPLRSTATNAPEDGNRRTTVSPMDSKGREERGVLISGRMQSGGFINEGIKMTRIVLLALVLSIVAPIATAVAGPCGTSSDRAADGSRCGDRAADRRSGGR